MNEPLLHSFTGQSVAEVMDTYHNIVASGQVEILSREWNIFKGGVGLLITYKVL